MNDSMDDIARRCFKWEEVLRREALIEKRKAFWDDTPDFEHDDSDTSGCSTYLFRFVAYLVKFGALWLVLGLLLGSAAGGFFATVGTRLFFRFGVPRLRRSSRFKAFQRGEPEAVLAVYRYAVEEFRVQIEAHRSRTLGSDSEWAAARGKLATAADEADQQVAYWRARMGQDRGNPVLAGQLETAKELDAKLRSALGKLDGRADVLRSFYNECEARIAVMDRQNSDMEQTRRLERLSDTADTMIAETEATLTGIGASFVREAHNVGEVLGSFERLQIKSLAGEAPLDDIVFLADRINESSESEYATVRKLRREIEGFADPIEP